MLLSSGALALSFAVARPAHAAPKPMAQQAPNGVIQGTWAFGSNFFYDDYGVASGTLTFDGNGGVTSGLNADSDGVYCVGMGLSGSYVVNPGRLTGTATMTISSVNTGDCGDLGDGDTLTIAFNLANNFKAFTYVEVDPQASGFFPDDFSGAIAGPATHF
jgi:hypothetical protein